ncbi:MAG TPA: hypothetical protein VLE51_03490 [Candidatus Saccharimonadales bacterium]|nr:hypothetical protein [Candidatus Saccharimonadales bacterium]
MASELEYKFENPSGKAPIPAKREPKVLDFLHALLKPHTVPETNLPALEIKPYRSLGHMAAEVEVDTPTPE